jgi:hypothetical protein
LLSKTLPLVPAEMTGTLAGVCKGETLRRAMNRYLG